MPPLAVTGLVPGMIWAGREKDQKAAPVMAPKMVKRLREVDACVASPVRPFFPPQAGDRLDKQGHSGSCFVGLPGGALGKPNMGIPPVDHRA